MLSTEELNHFKRRLQDMKLELEQRIHSGSDAGPNESVGELADYDNHPADMGTEQFEQERDAGLLQMQRNQLQEIDAALERIKNGTYGISEISGKPIPEERLKAEPTARTLVDE